MEPNILILESLIQSGILSVQLSVGQIVQSGGAKRSSQIESNASYHGRDRIVIRTLGTRPRPEGLGINRWRRNPRRVWKKNRRSDCGIDDCLLEIVSKFL